MLKKFLYRWGTGAFACGCLLFMGVGESQAGVVTPPTAVDTFSSSFSVSLFLQPAYTGMPNELNVTMEGKDVPGSYSSVVRELNAFVGSYGTDTIDTEYQFMHMAGAVTSPPFAGTPVQFKIGQGNGFRPGLGRSPGQVAEVSLTPTNGALDVLPADSVFDLFIDVWIDLNFDDYIDDGEVLRNYDQSLRMRNQSLTAFPPKNDNYRSVAWVDVLDPLLGEFDAVLNPGRIQFYVVNPDGTNSGLVAAELDPLATHMHHVPEPTSMAVFGGLMLLPFRRRLRDAALRAKSLLGSAS